MLFIHLIGTVNIFFPIKFHLFSFVHCPLSASSVRVKVQGTEAGLQAASLRPLAGLCLSLWRPPGPLLSFPPFQTKLVKSTHLQGGGGQGCRGELLDRPVVVSGQRDACQTVAGCERMNKHVTECVFMK